MPRRSPYTILLSDEEHNELTALVWEIIMKRKLWICLMSCLMAIGATLAPSSQAGAAACVTKAAMICLEPGMPCSPDGGPTGSERCCGSSAFCQDGFCHP